MTASAVMSEHDRGLPLSAQNMISEPVIRTNSSSVVSKTRYAKTYLNGQKKYRTKQGEIDTKKKDKGFGPVGKNLADVRDPFDRLQPS